LKPLVEEGGAGKKQEPEVRSQEKSRAIDSKQEADVRRIEDEETFDSDS